MSRARLAIRRGTARDLPTILALIRGLAEYERLAHHWLRECVSTLAANL